MQALAGEKTATEEKQKISKGIQTQPYYKCWGGVSIYAKAPLEKGLRE